MSDDEEASNESSQEVASTATGADDDDGEPLFSPDHFWKRNERIDAKEDDYARQYLCIRVDTGLQRVWHEQLLPSGVDSSHGEYLKRRCSLLKQLEHPNILTVLEWWTDDKRRRLVFITEETGKPLKTFIGRNVDQIRKQVVQRWCLQIVSALSYLHGGTPQAFKRRMGLEKGFVRPDRIYIQPNGTIKIDVVFLPPWPGAHKVDGAKFEDFVYLSPEMLEGTHDYGPADDIYAFGILCLETSIRQQAYSEAQKPGDLLSLKRDHALPKGLDLVSDETQRDFIRKCLVAQEQRPKANDLLFHRFLFRVPSLQTFSAHVLRSMLKASPDNEDKINAAIQAYVDRVEEKLETCTGQLGCKCSAAHVRARPFPHAQPLGQAAGGWQATEAARLNPSKFIEEVAQGAHPMLTVVNHQQKAHPPEVSFKEKDKDPEELQCHRRLASSRIEVRVQRQAITEQDEQEEDADVFKYTFEVKYRLQPEELVRRDRASSFASQQSRQDPLYSSHESSHDPNNHHHQGHYAHHNKNTPASSSHHNSNSNNNNVNINSANQNDPPTVLSPGGYLQSPPLPTAAVASSALTVNSAFFPSNAESAGGLAHMLTPAESVDEAAEIEDSRWPRLSVPAMAAVSHAPSVAGGLGLGEGGSLTEAENNNDRKQLIRILKFELRENDVEGVFKSKEELAKRLAHGATADMVSHGLLHSDDYQIMFNNLLRGIMKSSQRNDSVSVSDEERWHPLHHLSSRDSMTAVTPSGGERGGEKGGEKSGEKGGAAGGHSAVTPVEGPGEDTFREITFPEGRVYQQPAARMVQQQQIAQPPPPPPQQQYQIAQPPPPPQPQQIAQPPQHQPQPQPQPQLQPQPQPPTYPTPLVHQMPVYLSSPPRTSAAEQEAQRAMEAMVAHLPPGTQLVPMGVPVAPAPPPHRRGSIDVAMLSTLRLAPAGAGAPAGTYYVIGQPPQQ